MHHLFTQVFIVVFGLVSMLGLPSLAAGTEDGSSTAVTVDDYAEAKATLDMGNYAAALPMLVSLTQVQPDNADAWNLLGFTYRKLDQLDLSDAAYLKVLTINPDHLGALEYQGELFLTTGRIDEAKANLARLQSLCGACEEFEDLEKAIKAAGV
jgi:Flp pilus assembly protein TadD